VPGSRRSMLSLPAEGSVTNSVETKSKKNSSLTLKISMASDPPTSDVGSIKYRIRITSVGTSKAAVRCVSLPLKVVISTGLVQPSLGPAPGSAVAC
jgi:hypothetical protein